MGLMSQMVGSIDIVPPLAWSEVAPTGFMVKGANGFPVTPQGRLVTLPAVTELVDRPEGTLHRFTFPLLTSAVDGADGTDREALRAQVAEIIAAFPTHVFGGTNRAIRFRGDQIDDQWRVRLNPDGTIRVQNAGLNWQDV